MSDVRVGLATVDFTPRPGLPLFGNFRHDYAARGVHDPLLAKAIVFEDSRGGKAAVLAVDLCMVDRDNVALMRDAIRTGSGVPPENVLVHATHTHSGPATIGRFPFGIDMEACRDDVEAFLAKAAGAVALAEDGLQEATLDVGYASEERIAFNRRLRRKDGSTQMNWEALSAGFNPDAIDGPWGPVDPRVACLAIHQGGRLAGALVHFGLHAAILAGDNWLYSADYPGYLAGAMRRTVADDFVCLFLNGCCGDVNHIDYRDPSQGRGFQMGQRVGYMLGAAAGEALRNRASVGRCEVAVSREIVPLERIRIDEAEFRRCEQVLEEAAERPPRGQVDGLPDAHFARQRLDMHRKQDRPDEVEVMAIRVGPIGIVGLPGEQFCQTGIDIRSRSPAGHTFVAGLCNDAIGYLPTRKSFKQGGYETTVGSTFYQPGAAEQLAASAVRQLDRLFAE